LNRYIGEVERQNKEYFEAKARDLLEKRKHDAVSMATANLLFKSLNINMEAYILKMQKSGGNQKKLSDFDHLASEKMKSSSDLSA
jgi:hypothetical protein